MMHSLPFDARIRRTLGAVVTVGVAAIAGRDTNLRTKLVWFTVIFRQIFPRNRYRLFGCLSPSIDWAVSISALIHLRW